MISPTPLVDDGSQSRRTAPGRRPLWRLVAVAIVGAVILDAGVLAYLHLSNRKPAAASALFGGSSAIRELQAMAAEQPRDPEWQLRLGSAYLQGGHNLSAIESFHTALAMGAPEAPCRRGLARAYRSVDRYTEALDELRRLQNREPKRLDVRLLTADTYLNLNQPKQARAVLDSVPLDGNGYPAVSDADAPAVRLEQLAVSYGTLEVWDRSLALARALLRDQPASQGGHVVAARALLALGRPEEAASHLRAALATKNDPAIGILLANALLAERRPDRDGEIRRLLEAVVQAGDPPVQSVFDLGAVYERAGEWDRAARCFESVVQMHYREEEAQRHLYQVLQHAGHREDSLYQEGRYYEGRHEYPQAEKLYRELIALHPKSEAGYDHLSRAQIKAGALQEALATLEKARSVGGNSGRLLRHLANAYHHLGDRKREREIWQQFIRLEPREAVAGYRALADLEDDNSDLQAAEAACRKCIELEPGSDLYRIQLAHLLLYRRTDPGRLKEAIAQLEEAVRLSPENQDAFLQLGIAYRDANRLQEAIWSLRHTIDLEPGDGRPYQPLGEALLAAGKKQEGEETLALFKRYRAFDQALSTLRVRVKRNARDVDSLRRLAALYERAGALEGAVTAYTGVLGLAPQDSAARRHLDALRLRLGEVDEVGASRPGPAAPPRSGARG